MKRGLLSLLLIAFTICSCKKDTAYSDNTASGNYISINGDSRSLGDLPNAGISVDNAAWTNPSQWQLSLSIKTACQKVAGLDNGSFEVYIDIWDKDLLKGEYTLVPGYSGGSSSGGPKGTASIGIRPFKSNGSGGLTFFDAMSGKITITKTTNGTLKSVVFSNIPLSQYNSKSYTLSGRIEVQ